jgi:hypothetical protein
MEDTSRNPIPTTFVFGSKGSERDKRETTMKVDIYRNLNRAKQGLPEQWSIRHKRLVVGYTSAAILKDATTYVQDGAVEKIRASGRKQVCAWFVGEWTPTTVLRTERHRGKDIPIYSAPFTGGFSGHHCRASYTTTASRVSFNPRHSDIHIARRFFYSLDARPIARTDQFSRVYFSDTHKAWVIN